MPDYRRAFRRGGTFFFTVVTEQRQPILCGSAARQILHEQFATCLKILPYSQEAMVLLPDHLHSMWTLPEGDANYSRRWAGIKKGFVNEWIARGGAEAPTSASRQRNRRRGVWQRRYWEHTIRDTDDFGTHLDYIHFNPVKHGLATCPHAWPWSTFHKWVKLGVYEPDWQCTCNGDKPRPPNFERLDTTAME